MVWRSQVKYQGNPKSTKEVEASPIEMERKSNQRMFSKLRVKREPLNVKKQQTFVCWPLIKRQMIQRENNTEWDG